MGGRGHQCAWRTGHGAMTISNTIVNTISHTAVVTSNLVYPRSQPQAAPASITMRTRTSRTSTNGAASPSCSGSVRRPQSRYAASGTAPRRGLRCSSCCRSSANALVTSSFTPSLAIDAGRLRAGRTPLARRDTRCHPSIGLFCVRTSIRLPSRRRTASQCRAWTSPRQSLRSTARHDGLLLLQPPAARRGHLRRAWGVGAYPTHLRSPGVLEYMGHPRARACI
jgi:hypothetical protein